MLGESFDGRFGDVVCLVTIVSIRNISKYP